MLRRNGPAFIIAILFAIGGAPSSAPAADSTLAAVRERGFLRCGTTENGRGVSTVEDDGRWVGFFPDLCRAIAAAALGDPDKVEFIHVSVTNRFDALREGAADLLSEAATWTLSRDSGLALTFPALAFFDGQGFMVHRSTGITSLTGLRGASVCVQRETTSIGNLRDYDRVQGLGLRILDFGTAEGAYAAFFSRQCMVVTDDAVSLAALRVTQAPEPADYPILPGLISKEPLGPVVRDGDAQWADIVRWTLLALIAAEELGVRAADADRLRTAGGAEARRLLGGEGDLGLQLGLDAGWALRAVRAVGNYGEVFERWLGPASALGLDRGYNRLWSQGGLLWAPPFR